MNPELPDFTYPIGRRYNSVAELLKGEKIPADILHMTLTLIARDEGTDNPDTDSRIDLNIMRHASSLS